MSRRAASVAVLLVWVLDCAPARLSEPKSPSDATPPVTESPATPEAREGLQTAAVAEGDPGTKPASPITFEENIRPILESRCQPCHFEGGKVYDLLPFDTPKTVRTLGTKLFSRIKDESEQAVIQAFLDQGDANP